MRIDMQPLPCTQPASGLPVTEIESPSISYTPEQYGTWEAFTHHPDYERTKQQYGQIFTAIDTLINRHAYHPEPQQAAFAQFIIRIFSGYFTDRATLIYGEGKRLFDTLHTLIQHEDIALEIRLTAIRNLSQEIRACADGAMNSLIGIVRQLQCQLAGNRGEVQRIREQLLEQLILAFHQQKLAAHEDDDEGMEKHHIAVYHNFLRPHYDLPSLEHDVFARQTSRGISDADLNACAEYVAARLTPMRIATLLAEHYLAAVQAAFPPQGLTWHEARDTLEALRTQLAPLYGEISDLFVLEDKDELYQPVRRPIRLTITILTLLQQQGLVDDLPFCVVAEYALPDRIIRREVQDHTTGASIGEKQRLRGEIKSIYVAEGEFWLCSDQDSTPQFVTLSDISDLFTHRPPYLSVLMPEHISSLIRETIRNSTEEELAQTLAAHPRIPPLLSAYLQTTATPDNSVETLVKLLSAFDLSAEDMDSVHSRIAAALSDLNYAHLATQAWDTLQMLEAIYLFLADQGGLDNSLHLGEVFFLNLYTDKLSLIERYNPRFFAEPLMIVAAGKGWLKLIERLVRQAEDVNVVNASGQTALMLAAEQGNIPLMQILLAAGADFSLDSPSKGSALHHAIRACEVATFEYLLNLHTQSPAGFDINALDCHGGAPLHHLLAFSELSDRKEMLLTLLRHGADVRIRTKGGISVLGMRYAFRDDDCYQILLDAGAEIAGDDYAYILKGIIKYLKEENALPLIQQILARRVPTPHLPNEVADDILFLLLPTNIGVELYVPVLLPHLQHGLSHEARTWMLINMALPFCVGNFSQTVLSHLVQSLMVPEWITRPDAKGHHFLDAFLANLIQEMVPPDELPQVLSLLIRHIDMTLPMKDGDTLLMHLVKKADRYRGEIPSENLHLIIKHLATHTALLSHPDKNGLTPFMWAVQQSHKEIIRLLSAANPELGQAALMLAAEQGNIATINTLVAAGVDLNACHPETGNALCHAVIDGQIPAFTHLFSLYRQNGFDINAHDSNGMTPLLYLFKHALNMPPKVRENMLHTLLQHGAEVRIRDREGNSVLSMELAFDDNICYQILCEAGAEIDGDDYGQILYLAVNGFNSRFNHTAIISLVQQILSRRMHTPYLPGRLADDILSAAIRTEIYPHARQLLPHLQQDLSHFTRVWNLPYMTRHPFKQDDIRHFLENLLQPEWIQRPDKYGKYFFNAFLNLMIGEVRNEITGLEGYYLQVLTLLTRHVDMTLALEDGDTLLMHLVKNTNRYIGTGDIPAQYFYPIITHLATHTPLLSHPDNDGLTPFLRAVQLSDKATIKQLLTINPDLIHSQDPEGNTPLDIASRNERVDIMTLLLQHEFTAGRMNG